MVVAVVIIFMLEVNRGMGLLFGFVMYLMTLWGTRWRSWLRHRATSRKVTGSIHVGVTGIFL